MKIKKFENFDSSNIEKIMDLIGLSGGNGWEYIKVKSYYSNLTGFTKSIKSVEICHNELDDNDYPYNDKLSISVCSLECLFGLSYDTRWVCIIWKKDSELKDDSISFFIDDFFNENKLDVLDKWGYSYQILKIN
jgi:hypothetical protein